ncbi:MAG: hypothetical protein JJU00_07235, partial [Opitutales bacterium]|nr:hypothetical protein [Opitutales bacterium]
SGMESSACFHENLRRTRNVLAGIANGPVFLLPVSAFGESEIVEKISGGDRIERPVIRNNLLPSFGLEDTLGMMVQAIRDEYQKQTERRLEEMKREVLDLPVLLFNEESVRKVESLQDEASSLRREIQSNSGMEAMLPTIMDELQEIVYDASSRLELRKFIRIGLIRSRNYGATVLALLLVSLLVGGIIKNRIYVTPISQARQDLEYFIENKSNQVPDESVRQSVERINQEPAIYASIWPWPRSPMRESEKEQLLRELHRVSLARTKRVIAQMPLDTDHEDHIRATSRLATALGHDGDSISVELMTEWWNLLKCVAEELSRESSPAKEKFSTLRAIVEDSFPRRRREDDVMQERLRHIGEALETGRERREWLQNWANFREYLSSSDIKQACDYVSALLTGGENLTPGLQDRMNEELKAALLDTVNQALRLFEFDSRIRELRDLERRFERQAQWEWLTKDIAHAIELIRQAHDDFQAYSKIRDDPSRAIAEEYLRSSNPNLKQPFMQGFVKQWLRGDYHGRLQVKLRGNGSLGNADEIDLRVFLEGSEHGRITDTKALDNWVDVGPEVIARDSEMFRLSYHIRSRTNPTFWGMRYWFSSSNDDKSSEREISVRVLRSTHDGINVSSTDGGTKVALRLRETDGFGRPPDEWKGQYHSFRGDY